MDNFNVDNETESIFTELLYEKLKNAEYTHALNLLKNKKFEQYLKENSLNAIPVISKFLLEDFVNFETEECIEKILLFIVSLANTKEAMLALLEEIEMCHSHKQFKVILCPLQALLLRSVSQNAKSHMFSWAFQSVNAYMGKLSLPEDHCLEGDEKKIMDMDDNLQQINEILSHILDFYIVFYEKVISKNLIWFEKSAGSGAYISFFLLQILHKPIVYLDIVNNDGAQSRQYVLCSRLVEMINNSIGNPYKFFEYILPYVNKTHDTDIREENEDCESDSTNISQLSLASYYFCLLGQDMWKDNILYVYSHEYVYLTLIQCCVHLLNDNRSNVIYKGIRLLNSLLDKMNNCSLSKDSLEIPNHKELLQLLVKVMVYNESKECRKDALNCLKRWIKVFDNSGKYLLFIMIFSTVSHSGIIGVVIHEVKETLNDSIKSGNFNAYFSGIKLQKLLNLICNLPQGEKTDLLENSDKIMSALNLLIFLCLSDKDNQFDIKSILPKLKKDFLEAIENGLRISKGHYDLKLKDLNSGIKSKSSPQLSVSVGLSSYMGMTPAEEKEVILQALNWFDIIQSVWARTNKIVENSINIET